MTIYKVIPLYRNNEKYHAVFPFDLKGTIKLYGILSLLKSIITKYCYFNGKKAYKHAIRLDNKGVK